MRPDQGETEPHGLTQAGAAFFGSPEKSAYGQNQNLRPQRIIVTTSHVGYIGAAFIDHVLRVNLHTVSAHVH